MKLIKENLGVFVLAVPVLLSIFGLLIINTHLYDYGIVEFSLFKVQSLWVGALFCLLNFISLIVFMLFNDYKVSQSTNLRTIFYTSCLKIFLLSYVLYIFTDKIYIDDFYIYHPNITVGFAQQIGQRSVLFFILATILVIKVVKNEKEKNEGNISSSSKILILIISLMFVFSVFIPFVASMKFDNTLGAYFEYFTIIGISYFLNKVIAKSVLKDEFAGVKEETYSSFSTGNIKTNRDNFKLEILLLPIILLVMIVPLIMFYSRNIYPNFGVQYGGGKHKEVVITTVNNTVYTGRILHNNEDYIFLLDLENDDVNVITWEEARKIKD